MIHFVAVDFTECRSEENTSAMFMHMDYVH